MGVFLYRAGATHAHALIERGAIEEGSWEFTAADGDALLGPDGDRWSNYGLVHLAIDDDEPIQSKARYKFPVAKLVAGKQKVFVGALHAAASYAARDGRHDIAHAAESLESLAARLRSANKGAVSGKLGIAPESVTVRKQISGVVVKAAGLPANTLRFDITTDAVDRDGDVLNIKGGKFAEYQANPIFLWAHRFDMPPIGKAVNIAPSPDGRAIYADIQFAVEESEFAAQVFKLYKGGYLNAVSIGFRILQAEPGDLTIRSRPDIDRKCKRYISSWNLLEISAVPIPSNPEALRKAMADGIVLTKSLREALMPEASPAPTTNPISSALGWLTKTLGLSEATVSKMTLGEIKGLANVEIKRVATSTKDEPATTAEDDEVKPEGKAEACPKCGKSGDECGCLEKPANARRRRRDAAGATPVAASLEAKRIDMGHVRVRTADEVAAGVVAELVAGLSPSAKVVGTPIVIKTMDEVVAETTAVIQAQLPDLIKGLVKAAAEAHLARLRGRV